MHEPPYPGAPAAAPPRAPALGTAATDEGLLEVRSVCKAFPGVVALDAVSLRLRSGTVHAVIGENGAGKSTLMKIIAGLYTPDAGELLLRGRPVRLRSPRTRAQPCRTPQWRSNTPRSA